MVYIKIDSLKKKIDAISPYEGQMFGQLKDYFRILLTYSSNALEGNSLTISETKVLLEDGLTIGGKPLKDTYEALGHAKSYDFMFSLIEKREITKQDILTLHELFYSGIDRKNAGVYRKQEVFITGSEYSVTKVNDLNKEMDDLIKWIKDDRHKYHPVEYAALLHKNFVFVHPFIDGNGRISRLLMNLALIQDGYMIGIIPPILRVEYINLLERAHFDDRPFIDFIAERVYETQKEVVRLLHIQ